MRFNSIGSKIILVSIILVQIISMGNKVYSQETFLAYSGGIDWCEEKHYLDNFVVSLKKNPEMIGYIGYYSGDDIGKRAMEKQITRAIKYLKKEIPGDAIVVRYLGEQEEAKVYLQPLDRDEKAPWN